MKMLDVKSELALATLILGAGFCISIFAFNVTWLWAAWLLTVGFYEGSALSSRVSRIAVLICLFSTFFVLFAIFARSMPIYSLNWIGANRVEISSLGEEWRIVLRRR